SGGDLPIPPLAREPGLDVVPLRVGRAELAGAAVHDPVGDLQRAEPLLLPGQDPFVLVPGLVRHHEAEHLELVELAEPEDALGVLAVGPGLAAEAGGVPEVSN